MLVSPIPWFLEEISNELKYMDHRSRQMRKITHQMKRDNAETFLPFKALMKNLIWRK